MSIKVAILSALPAMLTIACGAQSVTSVEHVSAPREAAAVHTSEKLARGNTTKTEQIAEADAPAVSVLAALHCASKPCIAPKAFVKALCSKKNPDAAVALFAVGAPLPRRFIRMQEVDAVNPMGPSSTDKLTFDEEVVVLDGASGDPSKFSVSGTNGHNVLRFDGTCAAVMDDELTNKRPPEPHHAQLSWSSLDSHMQDVLIGNREVKKARHEQRENCGPACLSSPNARCVETRLRLADAVASAVQSKLALPDVYLR